MGHGLGCVAWRGILAWQKQAPAGKSQVERVEQPDGPDFRWRFPPLRACVGPFTNGPGRDPESCHDRISDRQYCARSEHALLA